jgi:hypothetical protein
MKNRRERKYTKDIVDSPGYVRTIKDIIIAIAPNPIWANRIHPCVFELDSFIN